MAIPRAKYDVTWYSEENMALVMDIPIDTLEDLWAVKFGREHYISEEKFMDTPSQVEFYRAATAKLLMEGRLLKQVDLAQNGIAFYLKDKP